MNAIDASSLFSKALKAASIPSSNVPSPRAVAPVSAWPRRKPLVSPRPRSSPSRSSASRQARSVLPSSRAAGSSSEPSRGSVVIDVSPTLRSDHRVRRRLPLRRLRHATHTKRRSFQMGFETDSEVLACEQAEKAQPMSYKPFCSDNHTPPDTSLKFVISFEI